MTFELFKNIFVLIAATGAIVVAVYDLITGKMTNNPKRGRSIIVALWIVMLGTAIKLIADALQYFGYIE